MIGSHTHFTRGVIHGRTHSVSQNVTLTIEFFTHYTIMPILASEALLRKNKKSSDKMLLPGGIESGPLINAGSKPNTPF